MRCAGAGRGHSALEGRAGDAPADRAAHSACASDPEPPERDVRSIAGEQPGVSVAGRTRWTRRPGCPTANFPIPDARRFESQHILHYISQENVPKWVALAEGAGGALGWLTVRQPAKPTKHTALSPCNRSQNARGRLAISRLQTHERKEAMWCAALPRPLHAPAPPPHHPSPHRPTASPPCQFPTPRRSQGRQHPPPLRLLLRPAGL